MSKNIFEYATRAALRYPSVRGALTTEQLWTLPLTSKDGFDLDSIARTINKQLKETSEESFVDRPSVSENEMLSTSLEILKHIIQVRIEERDAIELQMKKRKERQRLLEILSQKEDQELQGLSVDEIRQRLDAIGS